MREWQIVLLWFVIVAAWVAVAVFAGWILATVLHDWLPPHIHRMVVVLIVIAFIVLAIRFGRRLTQ